MGRVDYIARAKALGFDREYKALRDLRQHFGLADDSQLLDLPSRLRHALGLVTDTADLRRATAILQRGIASLRNIDDRVLAHMIWNVDAHDDADIAGLLAGLDLSGTAWLDRCEELAESKVTRWSNEDTIRKESDRVAFLVCRWLLAQNDDTTLEPDTFRDPYSMFAAGVIAYARLLHEEERDPALLRLRSATSLTLHVLGFHAERVQLGEWAEQAARYVHDVLTLMSILIDDLGWAKYLLGNAAGASNIAEALTEGDRVPAGQRDDEWALLMAKAQRHLGVIETEATGRLATTRFDAAEAYLAGVKHSRAAEIDLAHVHYARALALFAAAGNAGPSEASMAVADEEPLLRQALAEVRLGRDGFQEASDQGRYAKALVLEVRLLRALGEPDSAARLAKIRDRAVRESVWSRPAGRKYIAGRPMPRYDWSQYE